MEVMEDDEEKARKNTKMSKKMSLNGTKKEAMVLIVEIKDLVWLIVIKGIGYL
ncbi:hypothetical protein CXB51_025425 [Gossypium anomalum]|uniref:Uncharacterized protein n=1 Tax=Gossypium anomalum TaxID=47600 RepID=A0A8J5YQT2_9ROSI|nr:hypothetical protein CXB51_025425 [Gossypium anomalum]